MNASLPVLARIEIASPCPTRWGDMAGDDRVRFCGICEKNVYNFSAMTTEEVEGLVTRTEGRICGRFYRRADGSVLTADCPVGVQERVERRQKRFAGVAAAFAGLFLSGCLNESGGPSTRNPPAQQTDEGRSQCPGTLKPLNIPLANQPALLGEVYVQPQDNAPAVPPGPAAPVAQPIDAGQ